MSLGVSGAAIPQFNTTALSRRAEWRSMIEHLGIDGSAVNLNGLVTDSLAPSAMWRVQVASGDALPVSFRADFRTLWDFSTGAAAASKRLIFRPYLNGTHSWGWGQVFPGLSGASIPGATPRAPSLTISAWLRKKIAGDATHAKRGIGFASTIVMAPSNGVAMCGLFGDGVTGFRFGSVNCPDGQAAGEIAANAIDAGAVQPAELVSPGVTWFHVAIRLFPPGPGEPGKWAGYLNGRLIKVFDQLANLPRGGGGVSAGREFSTVEPGILAYGDAAAINGYLVWDARVTIDDTWNV